MKYARCGAIMSPGTDMNPTHDARIGERVDRQRDTFESSSARRGWVDILTAAIAITYYELTELLLEPS
jgi:hypothetical protein